MREKFVFLQVGVPSRQDVEEYQDLVREVNGLVGRINAEFGALHWMPIRYINRSVDQPYLAALYAVADACLVSSTRDGMNLVALEYVACQEGRYGALVLSEFAGAASSLPGSFIHNPWNIGETAEVLYNALIASEEERRLKHRRNFEIVTRTGTADRWANLFIEELGKAYAASSAILAEKDPFGRAQAVELYAKTPDKRILFFDYDGTLTPLVKRPSFAKPSRELSAMIRKLAGHTNTFLYIVSGRDRAELSEWFSDPAIGLVAEHGMVVRHPDASDFQPMIEAPDLAWMETVKQIMGYVAERTPGSLVEVKTSSISFHYRECAAEFGERQANELRCTLTSRASTLPVDIITGKKVVEVRCKGVSKGAMVRKILYLLCVPPQTTQPPGSVQEVDAAIQALPGVGLVLCFGDDRTDEDMFEICNRLPTNRSFTVVVGHRKSCARFRMNTPLHVQRLVAALADLAPAPTDTAPGPEPAQDAAARTQQQELAAPPEPASAPPPPRRRTPMAALSPALIPSPRLGGREASDEAQLAHPAPKDLFGPPSP
ncbi:putative alpha-trehalose-phosphate synthase [Paratrimastix pyriformis]|uniref:Alpha-trehalose-phosphate synthase n=1 Tax=Paratrimastix pyriformis TaxID=342808 RepID=A0ABQ8UEU7_9EUKA|nr:putative alpha-trehalose-phosphate synthase [Paratrimastix pyriformis]